MWNRPLDCKTRGWPPDPENAVAAPTAIGSGDEDRKGFGDAFESIDSTEAPSNAISRAARLLSNPVLTEARREIAIAKLTELDFQSHRLGELVRCGLLDRGIAAETLYDAALVNGLVATHGIETVQDILVSGLGAQ